MSPQTVKEDAPLREKTSASEETRASESNQNLEKALLEIGIE